jgi:hypothetical protein
MAKPPKTLHEVIKFILASQPERKASTYYISKEIARRKYWARPEDGQFPDAFQIRLRVKSKRYRHMFNMLDDATVQLKE